MTSWTSVFSSPMSQRSSSGRSSTGTSCAVGSKRSMLAYTVKKLYVFHRVSRNLRTTSSTMSALKRRGLQGCWLANMNQRKASAPWWSRMSSGCTMLPLLLLIFWPSASRMWPRQTTRLKELRPSTSVATASRL